jgi:hypothetical protein
MKISINLNTTDVIDVMGIAWLKSIREDNVVHKDMALMEEDAVECQKLVDAIDEVLKYFGAMNEEV